VAKVQSTELVQLDEYHTFEDRGKGGTQPHGYKRITVHFVYAVKHDGRHKACPVANGAMMAVPLESVYSGVVSLRSLWTVIFLEEINGLQLHSADIGNGYLEARTKEKVFIIAGEGFGELEGHTLVIIEVLYGLCTLGLRWYERFADTLRSMGFQPSHADGNVWMWQNGDVYEYIGVYIDNLAIAALNPAEITKLLMEKHGYKLKGVGPMSFHLGCNFEWDADGTLCYGPKKYIKKMFDTYQMLFGEKPWDYASPAEKGDHPKLDDTELLDDDGVQKYQSMVEAAQWLILLGKLDVATAVMTMSGFLSAPHVGHLQRMKCIYGYVKKFHAGCIRVWTDMPDYSSLKPMEYNWAHSVYGNVEEVIPSDTPTPLGKPVLITTYFDANLFHDLSFSCLTRHPLTGTPKDKLPWKLPPMELNLLQHALLPSKSLIWGLPIDALVSLSLVPATCLMTTTQWY
jgi:Reverse transcriptase (RNA-dependent DNA polymerase)